MVNTAVTSPKMSTGYGNFMSTQTPNPMVSSNETDRTIRTARMETRVNSMNQDLEANETGEDKGSLSDQSINEKMEKPMLPPLEYLSSVHSTQHQTIHQDGPRTGTAEVSSSKVDTSEGRTTRTIIAMQRDKNLNERAVTQAK